VAFGVKNGNAVIEDMHRLVMDGIQVQGVVGRRIFQTWEMTRHLLENRSNGIQDAIWDVILNRGEGTLVHIEEWEKNRFEETIRSNPKAVIQFS
jgi:threonine 3-dehydrogenase